MVFWRRPLIPMLQSERSDPSPEHHRNLGFHNGDPTRMPQNVSCLWTKNFEFCVKHFRVSNFFLFHSIWRVIDFRFAVFIEIKFLLINNLFLSSFRKSCFAAYVHARQRINRDLIFIDASISRITRMTQVEPSK